MYIFFSISGALIAIASTFLGILILLKNKKNNIRISFFIFCLSIAVWSYAYVFWPLSETKESALFWFKILHVGSVFISVTYLHFVSSWLNIYKRNRIIIIIGYLISLLFVPFILFSKFFIESMVPKFSMKFWAEPGILYHFYLFFFFSYGLYAILLLLYHRKRADNLKRSQINLILVGVILGYIGGATNYFLWYDINIPPYGNILAVLYVLFTGYAIVKYKFLDIKLILRLSSVYLVSLAITIVPVVVLKYFSSIYLPTLSLPSDILLLIVAVSLFPFLRSKVHKFANKYLFTSLYDSKKLIASLSDRLSATLEAKKIYSAISKSLLGAFHSKALAVLIFDKKGENLLVSYNKGFNCEGRKIAVEKYKKIFQEFIKRDKIVIFDELKNNETPGLKPFIAEYNKKMGVEVLTPLSIKDKIVGIIALGAKESGDIYNNEDIEVLRMVSSSVAISLENANLYEETKKFNVKLTKEVEKATKELKEVNEELRKLDTAKSEFISIASHQLRTPLTVIKGYVSMMLEGSFGKITDKVDENLYKVYESNERLIHLVENLLNISRIESGRLQFDFEKVDLNSVVESVVDELSHNAKSRKLYLTYNPPKKELPLVLIDEEKIRQVIINIIDNAIKYTKRGGVTVSLEQEDGKIKFCSSDTGFGISPEDLPNLFKKFSRGADTSLVHTEGTGLGLFVGKMMIAAHKGKIWAESGGSGKGSKFCFTLPIEIKNPPKKLEGKKAG